MCIVHMYIKGVDRENGTHTHTHTHTPFCLDVSAGPYVVFAGEHKLIVQDPLRLMVETRTRMQLNHLREGIMYIHVVG